MVIQVALLSPTLTSSLMRKKKVKIKAKILVEIRGSRMTRMRPMTETSPGMGTDLRGLRRHSLLSKSL